MHETVYLIPGAPNWFFPALFVVVGIGSLADAVRRRRRQPPHRTAIFALSGAVFLLAGVFIGIKAKRMHDQVYRAYIGGKCQEVEGVVHLEHLQRDGGHDQGDLVKLGGQTFVIDYYRFAAGYQKTVAQGGVLREGVSARVWLCDGAVARIDRVFESRPASLRHPHRGSWGDE